MTLIDNVKAEAYRLGFHLVGVTTPQPPAHYAAFENWLAKNQHGEMAYLASERSRRCRAAPRQILPECGSILVLGVRYPASDETQSASQGETLYGQVASYAWGIDYHEVVADKLEALTTFIEAEVGYSIPKCYYTDTGPILERELAQRAGLGWIGKNTCLINPHLGSYLFLAEILLAYSFNPDPMFSLDHCGSCTRCIDACPTACILPDRTLDARRCLSYLTIEYKGTIPLELRARLGQWVFGCDICQQVCPWNHHTSKLRQAVPSELAFSALGDIPQPELNHEIMLSSQDFSAKFQKSAIKRAKRSGYLRNVAVAMGNSRKPAAVAGLRQALNHDPESLVRVHAAWALGQVNLPAARQVLQQAMNTEKDADVILEIRNALDRV